MDLNGEGAEATVRKIRDSGGSALTFKGDVAHLETQREIVSRIVDQLGALHYAVNNAGISGQFGALPDVPGEDWERVVNVNLNAIYYGMKYPLPAIQAADCAAL